MFGLGLGRLGLNGGRSLAAQIMAMAPKLWLDPSVSGGYQDSAGTTALYAPGGGSVDPPVGLALDKSGNANNASQATSTARPVLSARKNLLTYTEDFSNVAWENIAVTLGAAVADPDGEMRATSMTFGASSGLRQYSVQPVGQYAVGCWLKGSGSLRLFVMTNGYVDRGGINIVLTPEWTYYPVIGTTIGGDTIAGWSMISISGATVDICRPQLELGSTATPYQRVNTASDYDASAAPLYWKFDGVDDVHNVTFPSSLGSSCTVVTANRYAAPTILTAQTIGTSLAINASHCGKLVFDRALTAGETAIVTAWANKQGGL